MEVHEALRELRSNANETQANIAALIGSSQQTYNEYEHNKHEIPLYRLKILCKHYNVSADYILGLPKGLPYGTGLD